MKVKVVPSKAKLWIQSISLDVLVLGTYILATILSTQYMKDLMVVLEKIN